MSLELIHGTNPGGLVVHTGFDGQTVSIGAYELSLTDFLQVAFYVLTNTELQQNDPRDDFMAAMRILKEVPGWTQGARRLVLP